MSFSLLYPLTNGDHWPTHIHTHTHIDFNLQHSTCLLHGIVRLRNWMVFLLSLFHFKKLNSILWVLLIAITYPLKRGCVCMYVLCMDVLVLLTNCVVCAQLNIELNEIESDEFFTNRIALYPITCRCVKIEWNTSGNVKSWCCCCCCSSYLRWKLAFNTKIRWWRRPMNCFCSMFNRTSPTSARFYFFIYSFRIVAMTTYDVRCTMHI